jgi:excisionase family DNA binding protein
MPLSNTAPDALTISEAADAIRVSRRHLQNLCQKGEGPPIIHLGRRRIIRREALNQWLAEREVASASAVVLSLGKSAVSTQARAPTAEGVTAL